MEEILTTAARRYRVVTKGTSSTCNHWGTGNGKTTVMQDAIVQDIRNGKGWGVVDRTAIWLRRFLVHSEGGVKDVVYRKSVDIKHPIGEKLELPEGLEKRGCYSRRAG